MAIQVDIKNSQFGVSFQGAYFRIAAVAVMRQREDNPRHQVMIDVIGYATQPQSEDTRDVDFRRYYAPYQEVETQSGETFLAKCYAWIMSQPDMTGAVGV